MMTERNASKAQAGVAVFVAWIFIVATAVTILGLLAYRLVWIVQVLGLFGQRFDQEAVDDYPFGPIGIVTGDPSIPFFSVACFFFVMLLLFGRSRLQPMMGQLELALKVLVLYSIIMIGVQWIVLEVVVLTTGSPASEFLTPTSVFIGGLPTSGGRRILGVNDPHYVTLIIGLLGLTLLSDPTLAKRMWNYLTTFKRS
jgi:hypothetical protein